MTIKSPAALIWEAITNEDAEEVRRLLQEHPEWVNAYIPYGGGTFLHLAAAISNNDVMRALIDLGFEINLKGNYQGDTAIVAGCAKGNYETVKYLIENGAILDVSDSGRNPLFSAIIGSSKEIARLLLENNIDSKARYTSETMTNMDAIAFALERGEKDIAELIASWNSGGDHSKMELLLAEGSRIAGENNKVL